MRRGFGFQRDFLSALFYKTHIVRMTGGFRPGGTGKAGDIF